MTTVAPLVHGMYRLEPIAAPALAAPPPDVMYRLPNLHAGRESPAPARSVGEQAATMATALKTSAGDTGELETRQAALLAKLEALQARMTAMLGRFRSATPVRSAPSSVGGISKDLPRDVVVNASPDRIPYSLLLLKKTLNMKVNLHVHSSISDTPNTINEFDRRLCRSNPSRSNFTVTLIWKNVGASTELVLPSSPVVIWGEANIVRYLVAASPGPLSYKDDPDSWEIDSALDVCHKIQFHKTAKERQPLMKAIGKKLGKGPWLCNSNRFSVADLTAWSVIKQLKDQSDVKGELKSWMEKCEQYVNANS